MRNSMPFLLRLLAVPFVVAMLGAECPNNNNNNNNGNNNNNNNNNNDNNVPRLFVVNNAFSVSSFLATADGDVPPITELPLGASTDIFQARSVVVTKDEVLLVSRQNGGITAHDDALVTTGATLADRIVEGTDSHLDSPIAFAYDAATDTLYVGNINADQGILVFDDVSSMSFDGDVMPSRTFNPPDRAPSDTAEMTINAMWLDADGALYVADTSGLNQNSSRVLIYLTPANLQGENPADIVLTNPSWTVIEDLAVDSLNHMYVVDGTEKIHRVDDAKNQASGAVTSGATITVPGTNVAIRGIVISSNDVCFVADSGNHAIHAYLNIGTLDNTQNPARTIEGNDTNLFSPRQLWLVEDAD
ncbi:MAG: hypothetical protein KF841_12050 [Phycisphaerae bacterium]|nr:hypothetical protein [Phycisphaerae bacterium]